jgi:hypothetical protein
MNITDEMVKAFAADWTAHDCGADVDCCTRAGLVDHGPTFPLPPSVISALLRERADDQGRTDDRRRD